MQINLNNLVSISEANQNFEQVEEVANNFLKKHLKAFKELAK